uniref:Alginate lyase 2 domain-containing protein n=1 Tax=Aegilops tauschii TaxID=37682 RepID=M8C790_AEGTA
MSDRCHLLGSIPLVVVPPIDLEVHRRRMTFNKFGKDRGALQHVDVIICGAKPERQATTLMLHVYDGNLTFYHRQQSVLAHDAYDRWLRLNVVHDVGARNVTVYVDGAEKLRSSSHGAPHAEHYFKFGVYKQSHHNPSHRMESRWRNVRVFTKP